IDLAQLPDVLTRYASAAWAGSATVRLHGFLALTPQQRRLLEALRGAGMTIAQAPASASAPKVVRRAAFATPRAEIAHALGFARTRLRDNPAARIAIIVADLETRRDEVI